MTKDDVDIGIKEDLDVDDEYGSEIEDSMDDFFKRNKKAEQQKKMNLTMAL